MLVMTVVLVAMVVCDIGVNCWNVDVTPVVSRNSMPVVRLAQTSGAGCESLGLLALL